MTRSIVSTMKNIQSKFRLTLQRMIWLQAAVSNCLTKEGHDSAKFTFHIFLIFAVERITR